MDIIEFEDNSKWLVITSKKIGDNKYSYLIKVNENEDDFIDEYQVVKSYFVNDDEYMDTVNGSEAKEALKILIPSAKEFIENPEKLKTFLGEIND